MIKIEKTAVYGWDAAINGMRNSYNSWGRSDSETKEVYGIGYEYVIGKNDLSLQTVYFVSRDLAQRAIDEIAIPFEKGELEVCKIWEE